MIISVNEVLYIHELCIALHGGDPGIRNLGLIESSVVSPCQTFDGIDLYPSPLEKIAALGFGLISNHGFVDGNKRVGFASMAIVSMRDVGPVNCSIDNAERVCVGVASGTVSRAELLEWLTANVRPRSEI